MKHRRIRPTFLLRCIVLAACVVLFAALLYVTRSLWWITGTLTLLSLVWFIGIEGGLLLEWIEHLLSGRAAQSEKPVDSLWFVDLDAQADRLREEFYKKSRDNPTIR